MCRHIVPLRYGHEFKTQFEYLSQSSPLLSLSIPPPPATLPVSSDLSYHNKGKNDCRPGNPWIVFSEYFLNSFWKQFSHYFPWHPNTTSQPPRIICLWRSSGQTLDIYCNGKAWNISHFLYSFPFSSSCLQHLPTSSQVLFLHSQWMYWTQIPPPHSDRQQWQPVPANNVESKHRGTSQRPP